MSKREHQLKSDSTTITYAKSVTGNTARPQAIPFPVIPFPLQHVLKDICQPKQTTLWARGGSFSISEQNMLKHLSLLWRCMWYFYRGTVQMTWFYYLVSVVVSPQHRATEQTIKAAKKLKNNFKKPYGLFLNAGPRVRTSCSYSQSALPSYVLSPQFLRDSFKDRSFKPYSRASIKLLCLQMLAFIHGTVCVYTNICINTLVKR